MKSDSLFVSFKIIEQDKKISDIALGKKAQRRQETILEKKCRVQINEYLKGERKKFSIPLNFEGTDFQKKVWKEMMKIPYGKTISYKELAEKIKAPRAYRAVANACSANRIPIIIPCHRVVASDGVGGYSAGINIKKKLLNLELKVI